MTYPSTPIDKLSIELHDMAKAYGQHAEKLARDPYFREAIVRSAVSSFVWALYDAFEGDDFARAALNLELKVQSAAVDRAVDGFKVEAPVQ